MFKIYPNWASRLFKFLKFWLSKLFSRSQNVTTTRNPKVIFDPVNLLRRFSAAAPNQSAGLLAGPLSTNKG